MRFIILVCVLYLIFLGFIGIGGVGYIALNITKKIIKELKKNDND